MDDNTLPGSIVVRGLLDLASELTLAYGQEVVENRALPDFRDGLKPVARRILWGAKTEAPQSGAPKKSARVVGAVMGKFHPHGDQAIYGAMVTMVHQTYSALEGHGNFGNVIDKENAAAMRYSEVRVSKFGQAAYLDPDYLAVTPLHDNYDGEEKEPLYLPCLVPAIFMNESSGIAVGLTGGFPSLKFEGIIAAIKHILDGKKLGPKLARKLMPVLHKTGGNCISDDVDVARLYEESDTSLRFRPTYKIDAAKRCVTFVGVPRGFSYPSMISKAANPKKKWSKLIARVDNECDTNNPILYAAYFKTSVPRDKLKEFAEAWAKDNEVTTSYALNVTKRIVKNDLDADDDIEFFSTTVPNLLHKWVEYRIDLEDRMQKHKIANYTRALHLQRLYRKAIDYIDRIVAIIKKETEPAAKIATLMKVSLEDANAVLDLALRRLGKLSKVQTDQKIKQLEADIKSAKAILKSPNDRIMLTLKNIAATLR